MKPLYFFFYCFIGLSASAQRLHYLDKDGRPSSQKGAAALVEIVKVNDTCWERNYYPVNGPRFKSIQFKDQQATVQHGRYIRYRSDGCSDSIGYFRNGIPHGAWWVTGSNCRIIYALKYENGVLVSVTDSTVWKAERKRTRDSLLKLNPADTTEIESEFPGATGGWKKYLTQKFRYPKESIDKDAQGTVLVMFIVNKKGRVEEPMVFKSVEYYLDKEAMRLIVNSPNWWPAQQFGRRVNSYKIQPVIFRLDYQSFKNI